VTERDDREAEERGEIPSGQALSEEPGDDS
jgi:hypothetical protein